MAAKTAMWVHGRSILPVNSGGAALGATGPLLNVPFNLDGGGEEVPYTDVLGLFKNEGVVFRGKSNRTASFAFSIPTPVLVNTIQRRLDAIFVFYSTSERTRLTSLAVFDGQRDIASRFLSGSGIAEHSGNHSSELDSQNTFILNVNDTTRPRPPGPLAPTPSPIPLRFGLGVRIDVQFGNRDNDRNFITFTAAGADFSDAP